MMTMRFTLACVLLWALMGRLPAQLNELTSLSREKGAIYLEDFVEKPIKLEVKKMVHAYSTLEGKRYLGTLAPGQKVTLIAVSDRAYRVRGKAQQGQIAGWVGHGYLEALETEFVENLQKAAERKKLVDELIANEEVALGMTLDEVQASLGKPTKTASRVDHEGKTDTFHYITYERVPQSNYVRGIDGRLYRQTTYIKVETGKVTIDFTDGLVTAISESEDHQRPRDLKILPVPILF